MHARAIGSDDPSVSFSGSASAVDQDRVLRIQRADEREATPASKGNRRSVENQVHRPRRRTADRDPASKGVDIKVEDRTGQVFKPRLLLFHGLPTPTVPARAAAAGPDVPVAYVPVT